MTEEFPGSNSIRSIVSDLRPLTDAERAYVRRSENPYAVLSIAIEAIENGQEQSLNEKVVSQATVTEATISQSGFNAECRRIFRQYIPAAEKGRLRSHHRAFIARNSSRPPSVRHQLIEQLRRYDLSEIHGFQAQFNRERDELTVEKLAQIEQAIIGK